MIRLLTAISVFASFNVLAEVTLTDLNNNEVADAEEVMGNFNALKGAIPFVVASFDQTPDPTVVRSSSGQVINALELTAPTQGVLVVSGTVFVKNNGSGPNIFIMDFFIDDQTVVPGGSFGNHPYVAAAGLPPSAYGDATGTDQTTIAYTITVPVSAGDHTLKQTLQAYLDSGPTPARYYYNRQYLTVQYYPDSQASLEPAAEPGRSDAPVP